MDPFTILIIFVVGLGLWAVSIYNRLLKIRIWSSGSSWHDHGVSGLGNDLGSSLSNALSTSSTAPGSSSGSGGGGGGF